MRVVLVVDEAGKCYSVCETYAVAEKEKARLRGYNTRKELFLIERTVVKDYDKL